MYLIQSFGGVPLPAYEVNQPLSTGTVESTLIPVMHGVYDRMDGKHTHPRVHTFEVSGQYTTAEGNLHAQFQALAALRGVPGLSLSRVKGNEIQTRPARLLDVASQNENPTHILNITALFESSVPYWRSSSPRTLSASGSFSFTVGGHFPIDDAVITASRLSTLRTPTTDLSFTGLSGNVRIDCGQLTVTASNVDAYDTLSYGNSHSDHRWLTLPTGQNTLSISGGGIAVAFYERYA